MSSALSWAWQTLQSPVTFETFWPRVNAALKKLEGSIATIITGLTAVIAESATTTAGLATLTTTVSGHTTTLAGITGAWTAWTPTLTASGSMTYGSTSVSKARYKIIGKTMFVVLTFTGTTGGIADYYLFASLPGGVTPADVRSLPGQLLYDAGVATLAFANVDAARSSIQFSRADGATLGLGSGRLVFASLTFELA